MIQKTEAVAPAESSKQAQDNFSHPKVDYATDLFDMLSMDDPSENATEGASGNDDTWAEFQGIFEALFH